MHQASKDFMEWVKQKYPEHFKNKFVLDVGSLDVNGTNKYLFEKCSYIGLDIGAGENVDIVCHAADFYPEWYLEATHFDTIISTNAFEHDSEFKHSIAHIIVNLLAPHGLFAFSCATTGTPEHGTSDNHPKHSPFTNDYYHNVTEEDLLKTINFDRFFSEYKIETFGTDLRFYGIKKGIIDED